MAKIEYILLMGMTFVVFYLHLVFDRYVYYVYPKGRHCNLMDAPYTKPKLTHIIVFRCLVCKWSELLYEIFVMKECLFVFM